MNLQAILWDVGRTPAETEDAHRLASNMASPSAGLDWVWPGLYRRRLEGTAHDRRLADATALRRAAGGA